MAKDGKLSPEKVNSAKAQLRDENSADSEQPFHSQTKPEYDAQERQGPYEVPNQAKSAQENDTDMPDNVSGNSPEPGTDARSRQENNNDNVDGDDDLLVDFGKVSVRGDDDGEPDAWCRSGRSKKLIVRFGPRKAAKYKLLPGNGYNTQGLQNASDEDTRISKVKYVDESGEKRRRYTRNNIVGIVGVVSLERTDSTRDYKNKPMTYIKIKWRDIQAEHQKLLSNGCCWITMADLIGMTEKDTAENKIIEAWDKQEERYFRHLNGAGRSSPDRSPTPCPLHVFAKIRRERTRTSSIIPRSSQLSGSPHLAVTGGSAQGVSENNEPHISPPVRIKDEQKDDPDLFVQHNPPAEGSSQSRDIEADHAQDQREGHQPQRFSLASYLRDKRKVERWDDLNDQEVEAKKAKALAAYHHYKEERQRMGDIEDDNA